MDADDSDTYNNSIHINAFGMENMRHLKDTYFILSETKYVPGIQAPGYAG